MLFLQKVCLLSQIAALTDWPTPGTVSELRSFLGFASYYRHYRHFVEGSAKLASHVHKLVAKQTAQCEDSFNLLRPEPVFPVSGSKRSCPEQMTISSLLKGVN